jgi:hypothetical protein
LFALANQCKCCCQASPPYVTFFTPRLIAPAPII